MAASAIEAFLQQLDPAVVRPGLDRIRRLLEALDHPEKRFQAVTIAGTNGKGSVAACLSSILGASGSIVATYTSPHLRRLSERIAINGKPITQVDFARHFERVREVFEKAGEATYFEFVTAIALDYFRGADPDWAVLEVGLGLVRMIQSNGEQCQQPIDRDANVAVLGIGGTQWLNGSILLTGFHQVAPLRCYQPQGKSGGHRRAGSWRRGEDGSSSFLRTDEPVVGTHDSRHKGYRDSREGNSHEGSPRGG